ncbi:hypothetical protein ACWEJ6_53665 [Nonomuraea sp. NPDC004702]
MQALALAAAMNRAEQGWEAYSHLCLGQAATHLGLFMEAATRLRHALGLCAETGDLRGQADTCVASTAALREQGCHDDALLHLEQGVVRQRDLGNRDGQASVWHGLGRTHHAMRDRQQAVACFLHTDLGDHYPEAAALAALGDVSGRDLSELLVGSRVRNG